MRMFSVIFLIVLFILFGVLAYENNRETTLSVGQWNWELPFPVLIAAVYALGMLTGGTLVSAVRRSWYRMAEMNRAN